MAHSNDLKQEFQGLGKVLEIPRAKSLCMLMG